MKCFTEAELLEKLREAYNRGFLRGRNQELIDQEIEFEDVDYTTIRDYYLARIVHSDAGGYDGKGGRVDA